MAVQFFLAAAALLAGTLGFAVVLANRRAQAVAEQTIRDHLTAIPAIWSGYLGSRADAVRRQMSSLASEVGTKALLGDTGHDPVTLHDTAFGFSRGLGASVTFLLDGGGLLLERTDREPGEERGRDFAAVSWVATPLKEGTATSAFILDATRARTIYLVASAPIVQGEGPDRMVNGVIAAAFPMNDERMREFAGIARADTAILANVAPRGAPRQLQVLASTPAFDKPQLLGHLLAGPGVLDAVFARGKSAGPVEFMLRGEAYIGSVLPIQSGSGETIGGLVVARSKSAEMAGFNAIRRSLVLVGAGLLATALPISFFLARRLTNPIRQLANATSRVAGGDLDISLPEVYGGEAGALSTSFRTMVSELKEKAQLEALVSEMRNLSSQATLSDQSGGDPAAVALADRVVGALGGEAAWTSTRFLCFECAEERNGREVMYRSHTWDKLTGRHRLEERGKTGDHLVVLMNVDTMVGAAYINGARLEGDAETAELESAHRAWMRDSYWLLMPYKLKDPGINLTMAGETKTKDGVWDRLLVTFDNARLTPQYIYWVYVNRQTSLIDRTDILLTSQTSLRPTTYEWSGWTNVGSLLLASERRNPRNGGRFYFPALAAPATVDDARFERP